MASGTGVEHKKAVFFGPETFRPAETGAYGLLPFRFARLPHPAGTVLVTSDAGEFAFLKSDEFQAFVTKQLDSSSEAYQDLRARHFLVEAGTEPYIDLMAAQLRTRKSFIKQGPGLHIIVVSLRCDHSCVYCQVSRQSPDAGRFDMSEETLRHAVDRLFESPGQNLCVEFQGGEPALAFDRIKQTVELIEARNESEQRAITFTITSTLHLFTDEMLEYCREHQIGLSTSLDGPEHIHNSNRPTRGRDGYQRSVEAINKARGVVGLGNVSALTTLTKKSLQHPREIVDCYVENGFRSIFLRPLSPYGFALRSEAAIGYTMEDFLVFYKEALAYLIELNLAGTRIDEVYTSILLQHILTPFPTGYVDLRSPTGIGLGVLVYNYDGKVYASDEGRMLAETGDDRFVLGHVSQSYQELMQSDPMRWVLASGVSEALPGCSDCAFQPYCGADPVFHTGRQNDPIGHRPTSDFCRKHMGMFQHLFGLLADRDPDVMRVFLSWVSKKSAHELPVAGYMV